MEKLAHEPNGEQIDTDKILRLQQTDNGNEPVLQFLDLISIL